MDLYGPSGNRVGLPKSRLFDGRLLRNGRFYRQKDGITWDRGEQGGRAVFLLFESVEPCDQGDERGGGKREAESGSEQGLEVHLRGDIHYTALDVCAKA